MPRPTKYTKARAATITQAIADGNTRKTAAGLAGIGEATLFDWLARFQSFRAAIEKAEAEAESRHVGRIVQAADDGTWQASAWWLERRRRDEWGRRDQLDIEIRRTAERVAAATGADPDWLLKRAAEIVASEPGPH